MNLTHKRLLSMFLAFVYMTTQVVLGAAAETNFWKQRKQNHVQLASLSLPIYPSGQKTLSLEIQKKLPKKFKKEPLSKEMETLLSNIPTDAVAIRDVYAHPNNKSAIVLIQDVHAHAEAQNQIAKTLQALYDSGQINQIALEGVFGEIDLSYFRQFKNHERNQKIAGEFLKDTSMAAPSYVGLVSQKEPPALIGVDDKKHHKANVAAYLKTRQNQTVVLEELEESFQKLTFEKSRVFNPELKIFDQAWTSYHQKELGIGKYLKELMQFDVEAGMMVQLFVEAYELEQSLDFEKANQERHLIVDQLTQKLNQDQLKIFVSQSTNYRLGKMGYVDFYSYIKNLCNQAGVNLALAPHFDQYIHYVLLSDGIQANALFEQAKKLEEKILNKLAKTKREKSLFQKSHWLALEKKLTKFELTPKEWEELKEASPYKLTPYKNFYKEADIRSDLIVDNLSRGKDGEHLALVVGGFHTPRITSLLKRKNQSYVVLSPKIKKIDTGKGSAYLTLFAQEKTPLDQLFKGKKLFVANPIHNLEHPQLYNRVKNAYINGYQIQSEKISKKITKPAPILWPQVYFGSLFAFVGLSFVGGLSFPWVGALVSLLAMFISYAFFIFRPKKEPRSSLKPYHTFIIGFLSGAVFNSLFNFSLVYAMALASIVVFIAFFVFIAHELIGHGLALWMTPEEERPPYEAKFDLLGGAGVSFFRFEFITVPMFASTLFFTLLPAVFLMGVLYFLGVNDEFLKLLIVTSGGLMLSFFVPWQNILSRANQIFWEATDLEWALDRDLVFENLSTLETLVFIPIVVFNFFLYLFTRQNSRFPNQILDSPHSDLKVSVVVPLYKELSNGNFFDQLRSFLIQDADPKSFEVIYVVNNTLGEVLRRAPGYRENQKLLEIAGYLKSPPGTKEPRVVKNLPPENRALILEAREKKLNLHFIDYATKGHFRQMANIRNRGVLEASKRFKRIDFDGWVANLDADTTVPPHYVSRLRYYSENSDARILYTNIDFKFKPSRSDDEFIFQSLFRRISGRVYGFFQNGFLAHFHGAAFGPTIVAKASFWEEQGGFAEREGSEDTEFSDRNAHSNEGILAYDITVLSQERIRSVGFDSLDRENVLAAANRGELDPEEENITPLERPFRSFLFSYILQANIYLKRGVGLEGILETWGFDPKAAKLDVPIKDIITGSSKAFERMINIWGFNPPIDQNQSFRDQMNKLSRDFVVAASDLHGFLMGEIQKVRIKESVTDFMENLLKKNFPDQYHIWNGMIEAALQDEREKMDSFKQSLLSVLNEQEIKTALKNSDNSVLRDLSASPWFIEKLTQENPIESLTQAYPDWLLPLKETPIRLDSVYALTFVQFMQRVRYEEGFARDFREFLMNALGFEFSTTYKPKEFIGQQWLDPFSLVHHAVSIILQGGVIFSIAAVINSNLAWGWAVLIVSSLSYFGLNILSTVVSLRLGIKAKSLGSTERKVESRLEDQVNNWIGTIGEKYNVEASVQFVDQLSFGRLAQVDKSNPKKPIVYILKTLVAQKEDQTEAEILFRQQWILPLVLDHEEQRIKLAQTRIPSFFHSFLIYALKLIAIPKLYFKNRKPKIPKPEDLTLVEPFERGVYKLIDRWNRHWFLKVGEEKRIKREWLGYAQAELIGVHVPPYAIIDIENISDLEVSNVSFKEAFLSRDVNEVEFDDLNRKKESGLEEFLVFMALTGADDFERNHNVVKRSINGLDRFIAWDLGDAGDLGVLNRNLDNITYPVDFMGEVAPQLDTWKLKKIIMRTSALSRRMFGQNFKKAGISVKENMPELIASSQYGLKARIIRMLKGVVSGKRRNSVPFALTNIETVPPFKNYIANLDRAPVNVEEARKVLIDYIVVEYDVEFLNELFMKSDSDLDHFINNQFPAMELQIAELMEDLSLVEQVLQSEEFFTNKNVLIEATDELKKDLRRIQEITRKYSILKSQFREKINGIIKELEEDSTQDEKKKKNTSSTQKQRAFLGFAFYLTNIQMGLVPSFVSTLILFASTAVLVYESLVEIKQYRSRKLVAHLLNNLLGQPSSELKIHIEQIGGTKGKASFGHFNSSHLELVDKFAIYIRDQTDVSKVQVVQKLAKPDQPIILLVSENDQEVIQAQFPKLKIVMRDKKLVKKQRLSLSHLDQLFITQIRTDISGTLLILPPGLQADPDINNRKLETLWVTTLEELIQGQWFGRLIWGRALKNIRKIARKWLTAA